VPDGGLPGRVTPLVLTPGDPYERALAADLVLADEALSDLARRLDAPGRALDAVRAAALSDLPQSRAALTPAATTDAATPAAPASEGALAYLLARAGNGDAVADRFTEVRTLRGDGGSWGVVATLVDTPVSAVAALLDDLLAGPDEALLAAEEIDVAALLGAGAAPAPAGQEAPTPPTGADDPPVAPGPGPGDPGDGPAGPGDDPTLLEPIDAVVDTVLGLLPTSDDDTTGTTVPSLPGPRRRRPRRAPAAGCSASCRRCSPATG